MDNKTVSKLKKYAKRTAIGIAALFAIIVIAVIVDVSNDDKTVTSSSIETITEPFNMEVSSQIVKKVGGKYRYFFDIRNKDAKNFEGTVTIELFSGKGLSLAKETFNATKAIEPNLGTSQYIDLNSAPLPILDAETAVTKFTYEVRVNNKVAKKGEGAITDKFEDLSK